MLHFAVVARSVRTLVAGNTYQKGAIASSAFVYTLWSGLLLTMPYCLTPKCPLSITKVRGF